MAADLHLQSHVKLRLWLMLISSILLVLMLTLQWNGQGKLTSKVRWPASQNGYVVDVESEKEEQYYEVYLAPPQGQLKVDYRNKIFNRELTREFQNRYHERFGYIDTDGLNYAANQFTQFNENRGRVAALEQSVIKRRAFGEYMIRRLGEWHIDNYFKSEPSMRQVYELKEKYSNMQVEVAPSAKLDMHYSFSDNSAEFVLQNPYCDAKWRAEMDPKAFGPSSIQENRIYIGRKLNARHYFRTTIVTADGLAKAEWWNKLAFGLSTTFYVTSPFKSEGYSRRESSIGTAVQHNF